MSVIAVIGPDETEYEHAPTTSRHEGKHVPYGLAGVIVDECTVLCPDCMPDDLPDDHGRVFGNHESDYPGLWCRGCERPLATSLLVYESGPGSEIADDLPEWAYL